MLTWTNDLACPRVLIFTPILASIEAHDVLRSVASLLFLSILSVTYGQSPQNDSLCSVTAMLEGVSFTIGSFSRFLANCLYAIQQFHK